VFNDAICVVIILCYFCTWHLHYLASTLTKGHRIYHNHQSEICSAITVGLTPGIFRSIHYVQFSRHCLYFLAAEHKSLSHYYHRRIRDSLGSSTGQLLHITPEQKISPNGWSKEGFFARQNVHTQHSSNDSRGVGEGYTAWWCQVTFPLFRAKRNYQSEVEFSSFLPRKKSGSQTGPH
jgi:hypothetical protein